MDKKQLRDLMPRNKNDAERARYIVSFPYEAVKPVVQEMLRWLRTYRISEESPVAEVFIEFFVANALVAAEDVQKALSMSRQDHLKYVIVTQVLPEWPRPAVEQVTRSLTLMMTDSDDDGLWRTGNGPHVASAFGKT